MGEGGWIRFRTTQVVAQLIEQIRAAMERLLAEKIANPKQDFGRGAKAPGTPYATHRKPRACQSSRRYCARRA